MFVKQFERVKTNIQYLKKKREKDKNRREFLFYLLKLTNTHDSNVQLIRIDFEIIEKFPVNEKKLITFCKEMIKKTKIGKIYSEIRVIKMIWGGVNVRNYQTIRKFMIRANTKARYRSFNYSEGKNDTGIESVYRNEQVTLKMSKMGKARDNHNFVHKILMRRFSQIAI